MRVKRSAGMLAAVALLTQAATLGLAPAQQAPWTGRIVDALNGEPIAGAAITPRDARWRPERLEMAREPDAPRALPGNPVGTEQASDSNGSFAVSDTGALSLVIAAPGYLTGFVDLPAARERGLGTVALEPATRLIGRVVTPSGEPAPGRGVALLPWYGAPDRAIRRATTDAAGRFRLDGIGLSQPSRLFAVEGIGVVFQLDYLPRRIFDLGDIRLAETSPVSGRVLDADGNPLAGAFVAAGRVERTVDFHASGGDLAWITGASGADGSFTLPLPRGYYTLRVQPRGRVFEERRIDVPDGGLELPPWRLAPLIDVVGSVVDERGRPLAGVRVVRRASGFASAWYHGEHALAAAQTDADGIYRLVLSTAALELLRGNPPELGLSRPADGGGGAEVRVNMEVALDEARQEPVVFARRGTGIVGRVVDADGSPLPGVRVSASRNTGGMVSAWVEEVSGEDGSFHMVNLFPGYWAMGAELSGFEMDELPRVEVIAAEVTEVTIPMHVAARDQGIAPLTVRVQAATGLPAAYASVGIETRGSPPDVEQVFERTFADATGYARLDAIPDGAYRITARSTGKLDRPSAELTVDADVARRRAAIEILLPRPRRPAGSLSGRVVDADGNPVVGATIAAEVDRTRSDYLPGGKATSDATGAFRFDDIARGAYILRAQRYGWAQTPPVPASVTAGGSAEVELIMERGATVVGTLVGLTAEEIRQGHVRAASWETAPAVVNEDGSFRIENVSRGEQVIMAGTESGREVQERVEVPLDADTVEVRLEFPTGFSLRGRVFYRGQPVSGGEIGIYGLSEDLHESRYIPVADDGTYVGDALRGGEYTLWVRAAPLRSPFVIRELTINGDTELDIHVRGGVLAGRIVDAETGAGLDAARLNMRPLANLGADTYPDRPPVALDGTFRVGPLAGVPWRLEARAEGYAPTVIEVPLDDADIEDLVFELERTPGMLLRFASSTGFLPERLQMTWQSLDGARSFRQTLRPEDVAEYRWEVVPTGPGILTVADRDSGRIYRGEIDNRGDFIDVSLEPAGFLDLRIDGLADTAQTGEVRVFDASGRQLPDLPLGIRPNATGDIRTRPWRRLIGLPAGSYTIEVTGPDGELWRHEFAVGAGESVSVRLGGAATPAPARETPPSS